MATFYAVKAGRKTGVYRTWEECKPQVDGYLGAKYRKFNYLIDAENYLVDDKSKKNIKDFKSLGENVEYTFKIDDYSVYVDGSFNAEQNLISYASVLVKNDREIIEIRQGVLPDIYLTKYRHIYGELVAAVEGVKMLRERKIFKAKMYHDFDGIEELIGGGQDPKNIVTRTYRKLMDENTDVNIEYIKVKSHSGHKLNAYDDRLDKQIRYTDVDKIKLPVYKRVKIFFKELFN